MCSSNYRLQFVFVFSICFLLTLGAGTVSAAPKVLVITDRDVKAETQVFEILAESFPMEITTIPWKQLETEDLTTYNALVVGSRFSDKTVNGVSDYGPKIVEAVREHGLGFLSLNNYMFFKDGRIPDKWTRAKLRSLIPRHSDDPRFSVYEKMYRMFDECLATAPFNFQNPANTEFMDFIGSEYRAIPPRAIDQGGVTLGTNLEPLLSDFINTAELPAFGYIGNIDRHHWQVVLDAKFRGTPQAILIATEEGKGRVALSTLFLDHDVAISKNEAAQKMYIELLKWLTRLD